MGWTRLATVCALFAFLVPLRSEGGAIGRCLCHATPDKEVLPNGFKGLTVDAPLVHEIGEKTVDFYGMERKIQIDRIVYSDTYPFPSMDLCLATMPGMCDQQCTVGITGKIFAKASPELTACRDDPLSCMKIMSSHMCLSTPDEPTQHMVPWSIGKEVTRELYEKYRKIQFSFPTVRIPWAQLEKSFEESVVGSIVLGAALYLGNFVKSCLAGGFLVFPTPMFEEFKRNLEQKPVDACNSPPKIVGPDDVTCRPTERAEEYLCDLPHDGRYLIRTLDEGVEILRIRS
ncbi:MAG: hypothetical protein V1495_09045 [Pseudomonadota bacterium]